MVDEGVDLFRLSMSHCSHSQFEVLCKRIRSVAKSRRKRIGIEADMQGPRIRTGMVPDKGIELVRGKTVTFSTRKGCELPMIYIDYPHLPKDLKVGRTMCLASGEFEVVVRELGDTEIVTEVVNGGTLHSKKGVNLPGTKLTMTGPTRKDIRDTKFALSLGVKSIIQSFVGNPEVAHQLQNETACPFRHGGKIETEEGVQKVDSILEVVDFVMIGLGDMSVEIPVPEVPDAQARIIRAATRHGKVSELATYVLHSMLTRKRPLPYDVWGVRLAVQQGVSVIVLTDETNGPYPVESVHWLRRIIEEAERHMCRRIVWRY